MNKWSYYHFLILHLVSDLEETLKSFHSSIQSSFSKWYKAHQRMVSIGPFIQNLKILRVPGTHGTYSNNTLRGTESINESVQ